MLNEVFVNLIKYILMGDETIRALAWINNILLVFVTPYSDFIVSLSTQIYTNEYWQSVRLTDNMLVGD